MCCLAFIFYIYVLLVVPSVNKQLVICSLNKQVTLACISDFDIIMGLKMGIKLAVGLSWSELHLLQYLLFNSNLLS